MIWIPAAMATGSDTDSIRFRIQKPPKARPVMKALSISSKECVLAPSTMLSMRIQLSS